MNKNKKYNYAITTEKQNQKISHHTTRIEGN